MPSKLNYGNDKRTIVVLWYNLVYIILPTSVNHFVSMGQVYRINSLICIKAEIIKPSYMSILLKNMSKLKKIITIKCLCFI